MDISVEVRNVINVVKKKVTACKTVQEFKDIILQFVHLLGNSAQGEPISSQASFCGIHYTIEFKKEFISRHYSHFCEHVLTSVDPGFLKDDNFLAILTRLFIEGPGELSFLALVFSVSSVTHTDKLCAIVSILNDFVTSDKFTKLFISQCLIESPTSLTQELLIAVTSLPDKLANKMKLALNRKFHPNVYYKLLGREIIKTLNNIHEIASQSKEYSTLFLSSLIGKIALRGSITSLFDVILPQLKEWCYTSPLWSNICSTLLIQVQESALEPVIECLLKKITFYPFFCKILKDSVLSNAIIKHLITHKFLLVRCYKEPNVLQNVVGYLCGDHRRGLLLDVIKTILGHWGNSNTIKHSSYEQHFYVTQVIILAITQMNTNEIAKHKNELLNKVLSGVQVHLSNSNNKIRHIGMVTAECITVCLHPEAQKLKFEIEEDDDVKKLRALAMLPKFGSGIEKDNFLNTETIAMDGGLAKKSTNYEEEDLSANKEETTSNDHNDDDDDDDLQPFEMDEGDNDLIDGIQPPRYISQCIDGLLSSDDPKRHIASLRVLKKVIKSDVDNLNHQCVQLVTILLHLPDKYSLDDYNELRFSAMVEVTVRCPVMAADYLTKEFYAQNYSLRQRIDILDVLAAAAAELSKPDANSEVSTTTGNISEASKTENWKAIVQERIDKKTRRFSKKSAIVPPKVTANRFGNVAGHFFFPLLQGFDNRQNTFDLLGEDCMVLGSLVCTLGNIMYCAQATLVAQNMAKALLEFVWVLRYHSDAHVRHGLLFSLSMVVISVSGFFLMTEVQNELAECQSWVENVLHNDPSAQCRELALHVLVLISNVFQKQFNSE